MLLIACSNVVNLQLVRATARQREMVVRFAVGASRGRLMRQLLTESVVVSVTAGLLGLLVTFWALKGLLGVCPAGMPRLALLLAAVGIYGLLRYRISLQVHDIGIRMALGATGRDVLRATLRQGLHLVVVRFAFHRILNRLGRSAVMLATLALSAGTGLTAEAQAPGETNAVQVRTVNRKVADFPDREDMSTPEAAYATLNRLMASGDQAFWRRLSAPRLAQRMEAQPGKREVPAEAAAGLMGAAILEVQLWHKTNAVVIPFVGFLEREAADPQEFLLNVLEKHRVVILGEVHNRQRYRAFNAALIRSPRFAQHVGVIYLELPSDDQPLMDRFLAAPKCDPSPVIDVLRDMHEFGWPDQPTLEFCRAVWEVNQSLPKAQRLRIRLADIARPWKEIHRRADWAKHFNVDRDEFMASQIARDLRDHAQDPRHALIQVRRDLRVRPRAQGLEIAADADNHGPGMLPDGGVGRRQFCFR